MSSISDLGSIFCDCLECRERNKRLEQLNKEKSILKDEREYYKELYKMFDIMENILKEI